MALKDLQAKLASLTNEGQGIAAKEALTSADAERLEAIVKEGNEIKAQMSVLKAAGDVFDFAKESAGMLSLAANADATVHGMSKAGEVSVEDKGDKFLVGPDGGYLMEDAKVKAIRKPDYHKAFRAYIRAAGREERMDNAAVKVLQEGADTQGGYLVSDDILARLIAKEPTPTNINGRVTRLSTGRDALSIPKVTYTTDNLYTSGMRVTWTGEVPASATTHRVTEPTFGQVRIPIYTAMMSLPITRDMIEDSSFDIIGWCTGKFSETIDLLYDNMIINGTGAGQPEGIVNNTSIATTVSGAATSVTADGIVNLAFALPPQYDSNAVWVMNKLSTGKAIWKLKDGDGRYLWGSGVNESGLSMPAIRRELLGYPVLFNEFMPSENVGSNKPVCFGDMRGYYLVNRVGFSIEVLRELYAETNQVLLLGRIRFGGKVVEDWRLKLLNVST